MEPFSFLGVEIISVEEGTFEAKEVLSPTSRESVAWFMAETIPPSPPPTGVQRAFVLKVHLYVFYILEDIFVQTKHFRQ